MIGLSLLWNNSVVFLPKDVNTGSFGLDFKRNRELFSEGVSAPGFGPGVIGLSPIQQENYKLFPRDCQGG
jgi:hypothetical protein